MRQKYLTIIGNVSAGKSTLAQFLASKLPATLVAADELYKTNPFFSDAVTDRPRWSLASDIWFLMKRVEMARTIELTLQQSPVVQDSGLLMSWAYAHSRTGIGHMTTHELSLYSELYDELTKGLPKETLIVYLNIPVKQLMMRIKERGRTFELQHFTEEYLTNLHTSIEHLVHDLKKQHRPVIEFQTDNWCDIVNNNDDKERMVQEIEQACIRQEIKKGGI